jgi:hypothetical protein
MDNYLEAAIMTHLLGHMRDKIKHSLLETLLEKLAHKESGGFLGKMVEWIFWEEV